MRGRQTRAWSPLFLLSQLSSDFTGTCILIVILRVVYVVRMAEQEQNCILSWLLLQHSDPRHWHAENGKFMAASLDQVLAYASSRLTLIIEEHGGKPSKQRSRNWFALFLSNSHHGFTKQLYSYNEFAQPRPAYMAEGQQHFALACTWRHCNNNNAIKSKKWSLWRCLRNETLNYKTVETRLSFATAFSLPHPFVAFVLSESLGTRLH